MNTCPCFAACLLKQDPVRYERVIECCKKVTELRPDNIKAWYRLGLAHFHLRDYDAAKDALKQANKLAKGQGMYKSYYGTMNTAFKNLFINSSCGLTLQY